MTISDSTTQRLERVVDREGQLIGLALRAEPNSTRAPFAIGEILNLLGDDILQRDRAVSMLALERGGAEDLALQLRSHFSIDDLEIESELSYMREDSE